MLPEAELDELAADIKANGLVHPIVLAAAGDQKRYAGYPHGTCDRTPRGGEATYRRRSARATARPRSAGAPITTPAWIRLARGDDGRRALAGGSTGNEWCGSVWYQ